MVTDSASALPRRSVSASSQNSSGVVQSRSVSAGGGLMYGRSSAASSVGDTLSLPTTQQLLARAHADTAAAGAGTIQSDKQATASAAAAAAAAYIQQYRARTTALRPTLLVTDAFAVPKRLPTTQTRPGVAEHVTEAGPATRVRRAVEEETIAQLQMVMATAQSGPATRAAPGKALGAAQGGGSLAAARQALNDAVGVLSTTDGAAIDPATVATGNHRYDLKTTTTSAAAKHRDAHGGMDSSYASLHDAANGSNAASSAAADQGRRRTAAVKANHPPPPSSARFAGARKQPVPAAARPRSVSAGRRVATTDGNAPKHVVRPKPARSVSPAVRKNATGGVRARSTSPAPEPSQAPPPLPQSPAASTARFASDSPSRRQPSPAHRDSQPQPLPPPEYSAKAHEASNVSRGTGGTGQPTYRTSRRFREQQEAATAKATSASTTAPQRTRDAEDRWLLQESLRALDSVGLGDLLRVPASVAGGRRHNPVTLSGACGIRDGHVLVGAINQLLAVADRVHPLKVSPDRRIDNAHFVPRTRVEKTRATQIDVLTSIRFVQERLASCVPLDVLRDHPLPAAVGTLSLAGVTSGEQSVDVLTVVLYMVELCDAMERYGASARQQHQRQSGPGSPSGGGGVTPQHQGSSTTPGGRSVSPSASAARRRSTSPGGGAAGRRATAVRYYSEASFAQLEAAVCDFLLKSGVLPEPNDVLRKQLHHRGPPSALEAPYVPLKVATPHRTTPIRSLTDPFVLPYLCNGTALLDLCHVALGHKSSTYPAIRRGPKTMAECIKLIEEAQNAIRAHASHPPPTVLNDTTPVFEGDTRFILVLMEDLMRCAHGVPPRDHGGPSAATTSGGAGGGDGAGEQARRPFLPGAAAEFDVRQASPPPMVADHRRRSSSQQSAQAEEEEEGGPQQARQAVPAGSGGGVRLASPFNAAATAGSSSAAAAVPPVSAGSAALQSAASQPHSTASSRRSSVGDAGQAASRANQHQPPPSASSLEGARASLLDAFEAVTPPRGREPREGGAAGADLAPGLYSSDRESMTALSPPTPLERERTSVGIEGPGQQQLPGGSEGRSSSGGRPPLQPSSSVERRAGSQGSQGESTTAGSPHYHPSGIYLGTPLRHSDDHDGHHDTSGQRGVAGSSVPAQHAPPQPGAPRPGGGKPKVQLPQQRRAAAAAAASGGAGLPARIDPVPIAARLPYLADVALDARECYYLRQWLSGVLGARLKHHLFDAQTFADETEHGQGGFLWTDVTRPCYIFRDGIVLARLVESLAYAKAGQVAVIDQHPRSGAARRQNIRRVLRYLADNRKVLHDRLFLEEAVELGDIRAVVLTLKALRHAYPLHGISHVKAAAHPHERHTPRTAAKGAAIARSRQASPNTSVGAIGESPQRR